MAIKVKLRPRTLSSTRPVVSTAEGPVSRLVAAEAWCKSRVVGRDEVARAFTLAVAARLNCLFLGPPGTAKTMTVQMLAKAFAPGSQDVFDILLTKFTKLNEVSGPMSVKTLASEDRIHYKTEGFLPACRVGILDECFKGSSAILNSLLRLANERTFRNGSEIEECPIRTLVGMSNEFPEEPALLAAFFDRFPIKVMVKSLDVSDFRSMLGMVAGGDGPGECPIKISEDDLDEIDSLVAACEVPGPILDSLTSIRETLRAKNVAASDRRYVQAVRVLKASAVLAGRSKVNQSDLKSLEYVLWSTEADIAAIQVVLPDYMNPFEREVRQITDAVYEERGKVIAGANLDKADPNKPSPDFQTVLGLAAVAHARVKSMASRLEIIEEMMTGKADEELLAAARESIEAITSTLKDLCLGSDNEAIKRLVATEKQNI